MTDINIAVKSVYDNRGIQAGRDDVKQFAQELAQLQQRLAAMGGPAAGGPAGSGVQPGGAAASIQQLMQQQNNIARAQAQMQQTVGQTMQQATGNVHAAQMAMAGFGQQAQNATGQVINFSQAVQNLVNQGMNRAQALQQALQGIAQQQGAAVHGPGGVVARPGRGVPQGGAAAAFAAQQAGIPPGGAVAAFAAQQPPGGAFGNVGAALGGAPRLPGGGAGAGGAGAGGAGGGGNPPGFIPPPDPDDTPQGATHWEQRRRNFDQLMAGGMLAGAGTAGLRFTSGNLGALGREQLARFGTEGANAPQVFEQARRDARETAGMGFVDLLNYQRQIRDAGENTAQAREAVLALSDAVAKAGKGSDVLQRVVVNMSQIRAQSTLTRRDLRELDIAQLSGTRRLAEGLGISQNELGERMGRGEVSGEQAYRALVSQFKEEAGGTGKRLTEQTLPGQFERTKEEFEQLRALMGQGVAPAVGYLNGHLRGLIETLNDNPGAARVAGGVVGLGAVGLAGVGGTAVVLSSARIIAEAFGKGPLGANTGATVANTLALQANTLSKGGGGLPGVPGAGLPGAATAPLGVVGNGGLPARSWWNTPLISTGYGESALTRGATVGGLAVGAAAGYGAYDDTGNAAQGAATGVAAAAASMFLPGAAVPIAIATGFRYVFNELANRPIERDTARGNGLNPDVQDRLPQMSARDQADEYLKLAEQKRKEAAALTNKSLFAWDAGDDQRAAELQAEAETYTRQGQGILTANKYRAQQEQVAAAEQDWHARSVAAGVATETPFAARTGFMVNTRRREAGVNWPGDEFDEPTVFGAGAGGRGGRGEPTDVVPQVRSISNNVGGGRVIHFALDLPPSDLERDFLNATN